MSASPQPGFGKMMGAILFLALLAAALFFLRMTKSKGPPAPRTDIPKIGAFATNEEPSENVDATHCIDLAKFMNAGLTANWPLGQYNLSALPTGPVTIGGTLFRVGGLVQLSGKGLRNNASRFPNSVEGIPIKMKCAKLHFLHATGWTVRDGSQIGAYVVHFSDGRTQELPVIYGKDVRDYFYVPEQHAKADPEGATNGAAWTAMHRRMYKSTWENPNPGTEIATVDFVSLGTECAPFLIAITAE